MMDEEKREETEQEKSWREKFVLLFPVFDYRFTITVVVAILIFLGLGYYIGRATTPRIVKEKIVHVPEIVPPLGLKTVIIQYSNKTMLEIWLPFGYPLSGAGQDIIFVRREIFYADNDANEQLMSRAIKKLLEGPTKQEAKNKLYPLAMGNLLSLTYLEKDGQVIVNFSREFNPGGGANAVWQARMVVEETLRQFTGVRSIEILVEGEKIGD